jgi:hypothetical protein
MPEYTEGAYSKKGKPAEISPQSGTHQDFLRPEIPQSEIPQPEISQLGTHQDFLRQMTYDARQLLETGRPPDLVHTDRKFVEKHFENYKQRYDANVYEKENDDGDTYINIDTKVRGAGKDSYESSVFLKEGHIVCEIAYRKKPSYPMELIDYAFDHEEEGPKGTSPEHLNTVLAGNFWEAINKYGSKHDLNHISDFNLNSLGFRNLTDNSTVSRVNQLLGPDEHEKSITKGDQGFEDFFQDSFGRSAAEFMKYFPKKEIHEIEIVRSYSDSEDTTGADVAVSEITFWADDKNSA